MRSMRRVVSALASGAVAANIPVPAHAAPDEWTVAKLSGSCQLSRTTSQPKPTLFILSSEAGSGVYSLALGVKHLPSPLRDFERAEVQMDGIGKAASGLATFGKIGNDYEAIQLSFLDAPEIEPIAGATALRLSYRLSKLGPFPLPGIAEAMVALQDCLAEQMVAIGADPAQFLPGGAPPALLQAGGDVLTTEQSRMVVASQQFAMRYRLAIDAEGSVTGCTGMDAKMAPDTDKVVCGMLVNRRLYRPAHRPDGVAIAGIATYRLPFVMRRVYQP